MNEDKCIPENTLRSIQVKDKEECIEITLG